MTRVYVPNISDPRLGDGNLKNPGGGVINQVSRIALKLTGLDQNFALSPNIAVLDPSEASLGH